MENIKDTDLDFLLESLCETEDVDIENIELSEAEESALFLTALREECTNEEYNQLIMENAQEFELYGIIDSAEVATEALKNIVKFNKIANFNRIQKRAAITLAAKAGSPLYEKYALYRKKMIEFRVKIYEKFASASKKAAKTAISNSRRKASSIPSASGKSIVDKMDNQIKKMDK